MDSLIILYGIYIIVFAVVVFAVFKAVRLFVDLIAKILKNVFEKKRKMDGGLDVNVKELEESRKEREAASEMAFRPQQRAGGGDFLRPVDKGEKGPDEGAGVVQSDGEKEEKDIAGGLASLKSRAKESDEPEEETLLSRMPQRDGEEGQEDDRQKIKIPRAKKLKIDDGMVVNYNLSKEKTDPTKFLDREKLERRAQSGQAPLYEKPDFMKNSVIPRSKKQNENIRGKEGDNLIFGSQSEISRIKLRHKLRYDPNIYKEERKFGLTLNPAQREALEKKVIPQVYGRNVSKSDLKLSLRKLSQKMLDVKDMNTKARLRKEIKFIRKIGGIK